MTPKGTLADFIAGRKDEIIGRWARHVVAALSMSAEDLPQLINDLPIFLEGLVVQLKEGSDEANSGASARSHGRQRKYIGLNIGALAIEFALIAETILELANEHGLEPTIAETILLIRTTAQGTEQSVTEYAAMRDREIADQAAKHYSFVAHEIRTPLQTASIAAALLARDTGNPAAQVARLVRALEGVSTIVDNSLLAVRLRGHAVPHYEVIRVEDVVRDAVESCQLAAERKSIGIVVEQEDVELEADRKLIGSVLINLLANAIKFTPPQHEVTVRTRAVDDVVRFEVADACGGMPEDVPGRLFQPYVQAGEDRSGFGLGLMIVKQAVDAHGGSVRVINDIGTGCCFVVDLPLRAGRPGPEGS